MSRRFSPTVLRAIVASVVRAGGSSDAESQAVADHLVLANLCGHDSHGVGMLPRYVDALQEGVLRPNAELLTRVDTGSLLALDAQRGYGQVMGPKAMQMAIARARSQGSCVMSLADAHHLGRIGHLAEMAVAQGLVSIHFVNVLSRPVVAAWQGADGRMGTNPCAIGVPLRGRDPFVLDFATSRVAQGKMRVAHNRGQSVEPGLLIDPQGHPTTDPGVVVVPQPGGLFGALLPFGEHKGYGLAVACELLGGALSGGGTWHRPADGSRAVINSMLAIVIDPRRMGTQEAFEREALAFVDWLRESPSAPGQGPVQLAGEPERAARAQREREGIVLDHATWDEIEHAARKLGLHIGTPSSHDPHRSAHS